MRELSISCLFKVTYKDTLFIIIDTDHPLSSFRPGTGTLSVSNPAIFAGYSSEAAVSA
jgi:hypothetical protein